MLLNPALEKYLSDLEMATRGLIDAYTPALQKREDFRAKAPRVTP